MVDGEHVHLIRDREDVASLFAAERLLAGRGPAGA